MVRASIVLIGFMATGKTTISKLLSKRLNRELVDTDKTIEEKIGMTISEIFEEYGEDEFRDIESRIVKELKDEEGLVISSGGGVCLREGNIRNIRENHKAILLEASSEVIFERVSRNSNRPVLKGKTDLASIEKIIEMRKPSYRRCAHIVIDTDSMTVLEIVDRIIEELKL